MGMLIVIFSIFLYLLLGYLTVQRAANKDQDAIEGVLVPVLMVLWPFVFLLMLKEGYFSEYLTWLSIKPQEA